MAAPADASAVVLVDKQVGPTSHDVVARARRRLATRRVGHTGTLDPFADGLLVLCVGPATRLVEYFHLLPKTYEAVVVFGEARDTDDLTGTVTARADLDPSLDAARLESALADSLGRSEQVPPDYSARRKEGRRAYEAARSGDPLVLEARPIEVREATLVDWSPPAARVRYGVSTGTYVRALARDLGDALGCPAHLGALRRERIGPFGVERADPVEEIAPGRPSMLSPLAALAWLPSRELSGDESTAIGHGRAIDAGEIEPPCVAVEGLDAGEMPVALHEGGELVAVGRRRGDAGSIQPEKVFRAA